jgi:hypothetical protein
MSKLQNRITPVQAVLLGGLCAIGISCLSGSVLAGLWLRIAVWNGTSIQAAYAELMASSGSIGSWLAMVPQTIAGAVGGYVAAHGGRRPIVLAALSGLLYLSFVASMYINPMTQPLPFWFTALSIALPIASALLGGFIYVRKT